MNMYNMDPRVKQLQSGGDDEGGREDCVGGVKGNGESGRGGGDHSVGRGGGGGRGGRGRSGCDGGGVVEGIMVPARQWLDRERIAL